MAVREIKTRLALDGEQEFSSAIKSMESNLRAMGSELKAASSEFEMTGDRQTLLTAKSRILRNELEQQSEKMKLLNRALEEAERTYKGEGRVVDGYRIKINNTVASMNKMQKELQETEEELGKMGTAANSTGDELEKMGGKLDSISVSTGISALRDGWDMATGAITGMADFAEGTRDLRRQMAVLEQNAANAGFDFSDVKTQVNEVASLTGDLDSAVEGVSTLLSTGFSNEQLTTAVDELQGAVVKFKEMDFGSLSSDLQETIASGEAQGQFAELISRMGGDVEAFNTAMQNAPTEAAKMQTALNTLTSMGLSETAEAFKANNDALVAAEASTQRWNEALAGLGSIIDTIITPIRDTLSGALERTTSLINGLMEGDLTEYHKEFGITIEPTVETEGLRAQLEALNDEITAAWIEGDGIKAWELEGQKDALLTQIATLEAEAVAGGKEAGETATQAMSAAITEGAAGVEENAGIIGGNVGTALGNGIASEYDYAVGEAAALADGVIGELERISGADLTPAINGISSGVYASPTSGTAGGGGGSTTRQRAVAVNVNLDGRTIARASAQYIDEELGYSASRNA